MYCTTGSATIDLFADIAAILMSIVSKDIMGAQGENLKYVFLPPGHPILAISNNRNQNDRRICKKVCSVFCGFSSANNWMYYTMQRYRRRRTKRR